MNPKIIGIAGGSASGKTTIVEQMKEQLGDAVLVIKQDAYYHPFDAMTLEERKLLNYDHPDAFDFEAMLQDMMLLKDGKPIDMPIYDYVFYTRKKETARIHPAPIILMEGLLTLWYEPIRELMDLKIFVDTDSDERLIRRIQRDMNRRGRSLESIIEQYQTTVKPMHEQFILPTKKYADLIIPEGAQNTRAMLIMKEHLKNLMREALNR
ncbi:MAG: uridine kinase [Tissierellia bacterium]|jgi:uridine kinase|nr:uridine kinase [Bacillota bacterium]NLL22809.1 uridine kinase [Tissierellia bacterium]